MTKTDTNDALNLNKEETDKLLQQSKKHYKELKKRSTELREAFAYKVATRRAQKYNTDISVQEKLIKAAFRQKNMFYRIKTALGKNTKNALTEVTYTDSQGQVHRCMTKQTIEEACKDEGAAQYSQAHGTPFTIEPLLSEIG